MAATATTSTNGRPQRRQLSDQLDRLDTIIDALAEALPAAVTDACKEGARAAVKEALVEILATPELRTLIVPARPEPMTNFSPIAPPHAPVPRKPNFWARFKAKIAAAREAVRQAAISIKNAVVGPFKAARNTVASIGMATGEKLHGRRVLLISLGIGLVVGIGCLTVPQEVAAVVSAVTSIATAIAVQTGNWVKRAARRFGLVT